MDEDAGHSSEEDLVVARLEAVEIRAFAKGGLGFQVHTDVIEFRLELWVILRKRCEARERDGSIRVTTTLHQPTGRLKHGRQTMYFELQLKTHTSGSQNMPNARTAAQTNWMAMGMR